jgi:dTDP-glucose 4,6-dehydratase
MVIRRILAGEKVQIHASPEGESGSRHWLDAGELASAWLFLIRNHEPQMYPEHGRPSRFNIVGEERSNLEVAQTIAKILKKPLKYEMTSFHASRPGHDLRYALDGGKLEEAGWKPELGLDEHLRKIVKWYMENPKWLEV